MKKLVIGVFFAYLCLLFSAAVGNVISFRAGSNSGAAPTTPVLIAGTATPQGEDNVHPSMSRWDPACGMFGDATAWGVGCNAATRTCIAPSAGTPDEPCQPPFQLYPVSGTGNGTTATITYHSETNYAFPVGTPLNISGSTSWDTPTAAITAMALTNNGTACVSATDWCASFTLAPTTGTGPVTSGPVNLKPTTPVYIGGVTGGYSNWGGTANVNFGWGQPLAATSAYNNTTGILTVVLANPYFGATPTNAFTINNLTLSSGTCPTPCGLLSPWVPSGVSGGGITITANLGAGLVTGGTGTPLITAGRIFGTGQAGPNGKWTPDGTWAGSISTLNVDINGSFPFGVQGLPLVANNAFGWAGTATQPFPVTASSCASKTCTVSFLHPTACASSCVSASTQIVAGQSSGPIMAWMSGPIAPFAVENGTLMKCVSATHISGVQDVEMSLDNGAYVSAKYMLDPWGVGAASNPNDPEQVSVVNNVHVFCAQFAASTVTDGLHEIRAYARAVSGPVSQLASAITAEAKSGDPNLQSRMHYMQDQYHLGIVHSQDPAFTNYNNAYQPTTNLGVNTLILSNAVLSGANITYTYPPGTSILPIPAGMPVNISGILTANQCSITAATSNGNTNTYTYSGGCSFPVGSHIDIAGTAQPTAATSSISAIAYNSTTGDLQVTLPSAIWGATPGFNSITQFIISGVTGTGFALVNGTGKVLTSSASAGAVLHFTYATGLAIGSITGGTITGNTYAMNGNDVAVTATNGSSTVSVAGMAIGSALGAGGTVTEAWDGHCVPSSTTSTTVVCPAPPNSASTTRVSGGTIQVNAGIMCVVGGPGDNPPPFDPAFQFGPSMFPNVFQVIPLLADDCTNTTVNLTGCRTFTCGITPTLNSTLWFFRHEAGAAEMRGQGGAAGQVAGTPNDGSFWVYTNAGAHITEQSVYVDQWDPSSIITSACNDVPAPALNWDTVRPTYGGSYCVNAVIAWHSIFWGGTNPVVTATVGFSGGCTTFTNSVYNSSNLVAGMPILFVGLDKGNAGDGTDAQLTTYGLYFIQTNVAGVVTLATNASLVTCISEPSANFVTAKLQQDLGFKNIFFRCNHAAGCNPPTKPETVYVGGSGAAATAAGSTPGKSGWLNYSPDFANGTGQHDVDIQFGPTVNVAFPFGSIIEQTGRIRTALDRSWSDLILPPVVAVGPTPPAGVVVTGGSLSGTCPGAGCTETVTFAALTDNFTGAKFQAPTTAAPGQSIVVAGITGNTSYNCGTGATPCVATASTATSVSFLNPTASGAYGAAGTITPTTLIVEVANGTFPNLAGSGPDCTQSSGTLYQAITPPVGAVACVQNGSGVSNFYGNTGLFNFATAQYFAFAPQTTVTKSNCVSLPTGAVGTFFLNVQQVIVQAGQNDVIVLGNKSTGNPAWAYNACTSTDFEFVYQGPFIGSGANDTWDSGTTATPVSGHWWQGSAGGNSAGIVLRNFGGHQYVTNHMDFNSDNSFDSTSYVWGSSNIWNTGVGANNGATAFHMRIAANGRLAPQSVGGVDYRTPPSILHSYATYADYKANNPILCSGIDCITTASRVFKLKDMGFGTIPKNVTLNWYIGLYCNFYPAGVVNSLTTTLNEGSINGADLVTWMDMNDDVIQAQKAPGSTCSDSSTATMVFENTFHTDSHFMRTGPFDIAPNGTGTAHEFANRLPWATANNIVMDQVDLRDSGDALAYFTEGGIGANVAILNGWWGGNPQPLPNSSLIGVDPNSYGSMNWIIMNNISNQNSTPQYVYNANTNPSLVNRSPYFDSFYINMAPWSNVNSYPTSPGFPTQSSPNVLLSHGYRSLSINIFDAEIEVPVGQPLATMGLWPSESWLVDVNGKAVGGSGQPYFNSLYTCPWYCEANDTGDSLN